MATTDDHDEQSYASLINNLKKLNKVNAPQNLEQKISVRVQSIKKREQKSVFYKIKRRYPFFPSAMLISISSFVLIIIVVILVFFFILKSGKTKNPQPRSSEQNSIQKVVN